MSLRRIWALRLVLILAAIHFSTFVTGAPAKEFLTDKEIAKIQDAQEISRRVKIYLDAAALRLQTAEDRLNGKESEEGDPMEFSTPEDMLDAYYRIMRSVMINLDAAFQKPESEENKVGKALKDLKESTERSSKQLGILKKIAEDKKKEELWNLVNQAIDVTNGAHDGAELGLSKQPAPDNKNQKKTLTLGTPNQH
jgi:hypothetical protein